MKKLLLGAALIAGMGGMMTSVASAQGMAPFGSEEDAAYAAKIWQAMTEMNLAGASQIHVTPYEGTDPHGMMLETFFASATIDGYTGDLIVKRNYGPVGVSAEEVMSDPAAHLGAVTVMFRREAGYDPDNQNWFWVKYLPDGTLDKNPKGMMLAGMVAKGAEVGCIACHGGAPGGDYVFLADNTAATME
ncbi:MAG: hypothetical protein L3J37_00795 [Rhodobacteraceae bacterium]|nr:hypothetical protein [Paracoccaceae bacterium]